MLDTRAIVGSVILQVIFHIVYYFQSIKNQCVKYHFEFSRKNSEFSVFNSRSPTLLNYWINIFVYAENYHFQTWKVGRQLPMDLHRGLRYLHTRLFFGPPSIPLGEQYCAALEPHQLGNWPEFRMVMEKSSSGSTPTYTHHSSWQCFRAPNYPENVPN